MIAKQVCEVIYFKKKVNALFSFRPTIGNVAQADEAVLVIKSGFFQALPQGAVSAMYIADHKSSAHAIELLIITFCQKLGSYLTIITLFLAVINIKIHGSRSYSEARGA
jgi:hypothetical protein